MYLTVIVVLICCRLLKNFLPENQNTCFTVILHYTTSPTIDNTMKALKSFVRNYELFTKTKISDRPFPTFFMKLVISMKKVFAKSIFEIFVCAFF